MKEKFKRWVSHPAEWYEFWLPQSGFPGGMIVAVVVWGPYLIWAMLQ